MDKKKNAEKINHARSKRFVLVLLFGIFSILSFWWAYALFNATDCEMVGIKFAAVMFPVRSVMGNKFVAAIPFLFGCLAIWLVWKSHGSKGQQVSARHRTEQKVGDELVGDFGRQNSQGYLSPAGGKSRTLDDDDDA